MDTFFIGFILGIISSLAVYIFIQSVRRGKTDSPESLKGRVDRNNIDIRQSNEQLRANNTRAAGITKKGLDTIKDTRKSISEIITAAIGDGKEESEG